MNFKILDLSKTIVFAHDVLNVAQITKIVSEREENIVQKKEKVLVTGIFLFPTISIENTMRKEYNARNQHFISCPRSKTHLH